MKRKIMPVFIGFCLLCAACQTAETEKPSQNRQEIKQESDQESDSVQKEKMSLTYTDYSQELTEEESGKVLLEVHETCPVVDIDGNDERESLINRVFEQQHARNEIAIDSKLAAADSDFSNRNEEETAQWRPYLFTYVYEEAYVSPDILSIKATRSESQGEEQTDYDMVAYTFYVPEGKLLTLSDVFTDVRTVRERVKPYIEETVTGKEYQKYLLEDYENYILDILAEDVFYFDDKGMVIICNPGMLTEKEAGVIEIHVPYEALKDIMNEDFMPKERQ